ncbi:MAG: hypothetical protein J1F12_04445 [Muribaculaceae bacterium]|nr:hypothetical protein [Muribaculaceae bacterium]
MFETNASTNSAIRAFGTHRDASANLRKKFDETTNDIKNYVVGIKVSTFSQFLICFIRMLRYPII